VYSETSAKFSLPGTTKTHGLTEIKQTKLTASFSVIKNYRIVDAPPMMQTRRLLWVCVCVLHMFSQIVKCCGYSDGRTAEAVQLYTLQNKFVIYMQSLFLIQNKQRKEQVPLNRHYMNIWCKVICISVKMGYTCTINL
jgi:hypothetical protein